MKISDLTGLAHQPKAKDLGVGVVKAGILRYAQNDILWEQSNENRWQTTQYRFAGAGAK